MKYKIINVVGARPNFMKIAPLMHEMSKHPGLDPILVHTGQHYDQQMSENFFEELSIPKPDINLEVGSASHAVQTAMVMQRFEQTLIDEKPDLVLVVGDVNSTIACALTAVKLSIPVAHVEAGLRSFDRSMPEEINRILTDSISDYLFTTEQSANDNLAREGIPKEKIFFVGNVMIDTLLKHRERAKTSTVLSTLKLSPKAYALLTLHRPGNVDEKGALEDILKALSEISLKMSVIFPCHPRTRKQIASLGLDHYFAQHHAMNHGIKMVDPFGYLDFLKLMSEAKLVFTDSGGIQEETTVLGIPCITLRENTERPVTISHGTNVLSKRSPAAILEQALKILEREGTTGKIPELWDGKAAERIVKILLGNISIMKR